MRYVVRGLTLLLFLALAACWLLLRQRQFLLAGFAIVCLVEFGLSLRAQARPPALDGLCHAAAAQAAGARAD